MRFGFHIQNAADEPKIYKTSGIPHQLLLSVHEVIALDLYEIEKAREGLGSDRRSPIAIYQENTTSQLVIIVYINTAVLRIRSGVYTVLVQSITKTSRAFQ